MTDPRNFLWISIELYQAKISFHFLDLQPKANFCRQLTNTLEVCSVRSPSISSHGIFLAEQNFLNEAQINCTFTKFIFSIVVGVQHTALQNLSFSPNKNCWEHNTAECMHARCVRDAWNYEREKRQNRPNVPSFCVFLTCFSRIWILQQFASF